MIALTATLVARIAGPAVGAEPVRIAVLQLKVEGGADPTIGAQMTARLAEVLGSRPNTRVIAPDDIRAMLEKEAQRQLLGCDDQSCLVELGGALGADFLVQGRISKIEDGFGISLSSIDATAARALAHVSEVWKGESIALLELVQPIVDKLFAPEGTPMVGTIEVTGAPEGSQVFIDDQVRGTAPAGQMGSVPIGARRLRIVAEDHLPFERYLVVRRGELLTIPVQLEVVPEAPVYATWWFWTVTAVAVAGATTGAILAFGGSDGGASQTGVNVSVNAESAFFGGR